MSRFDILLGKVSETKPETIITLNKNPEPQLSPATTLQEVLNNQGDVLLRNLYCAVCGRNLRNGRIIRNIGGIFCLGCKRYIKLSDTKINTLDK